MVDDGRQAGADIELTEAMLMAGLNALIQFRGEGDEETVREIARAILHQLPRAPGIAEPMPIGRARFR